MRTYFVYILTNSIHSVHYIGVTNDISRRIFEHKQHLVEGFTKRYNVTKLFYIESSSSVIVAIEREKQIKSGSRNNKIKLIHSLNPEWKHLEESL